MRTSKFISPIRTRIAPSPTGFLHIGTARTALFNYLFAKKMGGTFVLRIEDTDLERSDKKFEKDIFEGLAWLGIHADESPEKGGPHKLYRQSERTKDYTDAIQKLLDSGNAFYCFHSEQELDNEKHELIAAKKPALHMCEYRSLDPAQAIMLTHTKSSYVIRFKTPANRRISFTDMIRGELTFESDLLGDFSIAKRTNVPLYNLAVVVDDEAMKISHVIRGEDHIANTPRQLLLIEALDFSQVTYAHLPLILGPDRSKMSKRHGATSIIEYREIGYLSDALVNFMALLGWNPGSDKEIFSSDELINEFSLEKVQKSGAIFDMTKLDWMNGEYIRSISIPKLTTLCLPYLKNADLIHSHTIEFIEGVVALEQPRLKKLSEIGEKVEYFFKAPEYDKELLRWKSMTDQELQESLDICVTLLEKNAQRDIAYIEKIFLEKGSAIGDRGKILWPLRVALTGRKSSPGPFEIINILDVQEALSRLQRAKKML
ncbi:MAG: glutamate--tRNA ligase [bacterium]|nr:glutamate--tRNA ligase [bacterium]MDZ4260681.1 glutamate--tRNA ligase [Candidatus Sungbacteria bacterium]